MAFHTHMVRPEIDVHNVVPELILQFSPCRLAGKLTALEIQFHVFFNGIIQAIISILCEPAPLQ